MDYYKKLLNHFKWTWLEYGPFHRRPRCHDRTATKLARAFAKRKVINDISDIDESLFYCSNDACKVFLGYSAKGGQCSPECRESVKHER